MDYSAANGGLWELIITLGVLSLAMGAALMLRNHFAFIRRSMMPTAVLAGFLLLIARETGLIRLDEKILESLVYHAIAMGFIAMSLRKALPLWSSRTNWFLRRCPRRPGEAFAPTRTTRG